jgi:nucleoside-diphosphate-sugar epimerase
VSVSASDFRGRRVLVTGGLGFIGSALARTLAGAGADVTIVDSLAPQCGGNPANVAGIEGAVTIVRADLRDEAALPGLVDGREIVFNLAGHTSHVDSMNAPQIDLQLNCAAQLSLLDACRGAAVPPTIVFASTRQIYGRPRYVPVDESHPIDPVDVNGIHKEAAEKYHLLYASAYDTPVALLRLTNTYGPRMYVRDARQTFLGVWIRELVQGRPFEIWGDGEQRRDFTYVDDAVTALLLATGPRARGRALNLGDERSVSLRELAELAIAANGGGEYRIVPFPEDRKRIDIGDYVADYGAIRELLGWRPTVSVEDGLRRTLEFFREHGDAYW